MRIRILGAEETDLLKDFLYEAIFIPEGVEPPDRSIIELPELRVYYEDFGKVAILMMRRRHWPYRSIRSTGERDRNFADEGYFGAAQGKGLQHGVAGGAKSQLRCPDV